MREGSERSTNGQVAIGGSDATVRAVVMLLLQTHWA